MSSSKGARILALLVLVGGCGGDSGTSPTAPDSPPLPTIRERIPVSVNFRDRSADRVASDGLGEYVDGNEAFAWILGEVSPNDERYGRLVFTVSGFNNRSPILDRRVFLDFSRLARDTLGNRALPSDDALGLPFDSGMVLPSLLIVPLSENGIPLRGAFFSILEGETRLAEMSINFLGIAPATETEELYTVRFRPENPDSSLVHVTFLGGELPCRSSTGCATWDIVAVSRGATTDIGTLVRDNFFDEGDYHLPFKMTVTAMPP